MYINAVANSVTLQLYLLRDFYNFLKLKYYIYILRVSPPPLMEKFCVRHCPELLRNYSPHISTVTQIPPAVRDSALRRQNLVKYGGSLSEPSLVRIP